MQPTQIVNNQQQQQFETLIDGDLAYLEYRIKDGVIVLMHTDVPEKLGGRGIGSALAAFAFDYAQANSLKVKVYCPFVQTWVKRHPERTSQMVSSGT